MSSKFSSPFMAKSPLKDIPEIHVGDPNFKGPKEIGEEWLKDNEETALEAAKKINSGDVDKINETINEKVILSKGAKTRFGYVPTFTTTEHDLAKQSGLVSDVD